VNSGFRGQGSGFTRRTCGPDDILSSSPRRARSARSSAGLLRRVRAYRKGQVRRRSQSGRGVEKVPEAWRNREKGIQRLLQRRTRRTSMPSSHGPPCLGSRVGMEDGHPSPTPPHRTVRTVLPYTALGRMSVFPTSEGPPRLSEPPTRFGGGTPRLSFHRETNVTCPRFSK